jgi:hypothetical protein
MTIGRRKSEELFKISEKLEEIKIKMNEISPPILVRLLEKIQILGNVGVS